MTPDLDTQNAAKINELLESVRWSGHAWLAECKKHGLEFRITEAYRTPERQNFLYQQGRTRAGNIVTNFDGYRKISEHQTRLAVDTFPLNCDYHDLELAAEPFGILHPYTKGSFIDLPHFAFTRVARKQPLPEPVFHPSPEAEMKSFARGIARLANGNAKERAAQRFFTRYGVTYTSVLIPS
jgi:hypothetical protein